MSILFLFSEAYWAHSEALRMPPSEHGSVLALAIAFGVLEIALYRYHGLWLCILLEFGVGSPRRGPLRAHVMT